MGDLSTQPCTPLHAVSIDLPHACAWCSFAILKVHLLSNHNNTVVRVHFFKSHVTVLRATSLSATYAEDHFIIFDSATLEDEYSKICEKERARQVKSSQSSHVVRE